MLFRSSLSLQLRLEALEVRCNLSAIDPFAGALAEPAAEVADPNPSGVVSGRITAIAVDPLTVNGLATGGHARDVLVGGYGGDRAAVSNTNNYFTDDYSLSVGSSAPDDTEIASSGYIRVKKLNSGG